MRTPQAEEVKIWKILGLILSFLSLTIKSRNAHKVISSSYQVKNLKKRVLHTSENPLKNQSLLSLLRPPEHRFVTECE